MCFFFFLLKKPLSNLLCGLYKEKACRTQVVQMFQWSKQRLRGTAGATFLLHVSVTATFSKHLHITVEARHQAALGLRFRKFISGVQMAARRNPANACFPLIRRLFWATTKIRNRSLLVTLSQQYNSRWYTQCHIHNGNTFKANLLPASIMLLLTDLVPPQSDTQLSVEGNGYFVYPADKHIFVF